MRVAQRWGWTMVERFPKLCLHWSCLCCTPGPQDTLHSDQELASQLRGKRSRHSQVERSTPQMFASSVSFTSRPVCLHGGVKQCTIFRPPFMITRSRKLYYIVPGMVRSVCILGVFFSQWRARVRVTRLIFGDWLGCGVTFPLWDLLISVAVYTDGDSELGAYRGSEERNERVAACTYADQPQGGGIPFQKGTALTVHLEFLFRI